MNKWNNNIKDAIKHNKIAHKEWEEAGKPKCPQNLLVLRKIETRKIYHLEIRKEESKRKHEEGDKIINAQTHNKKVFYQMIRKQRNNRNVIIDDLFFIRGLSIDASYQVSDHLAMRFQRRFLEIDQSETRIACGGHVC